MQELLPLREHMIINLFAVLELPGSAENEYVMKGQYFIYLQGGHCTWKTWNNLELFLYPWNIFFLNFHYFIVERYLFFTLYSFVKSLKKTSI